MTDAEKALELAIAALGEPYRCQHPFFAIHHFADFVIPGRKIVIEVDGKSHSTDEQKAKDIKHTLDLQKLGYVVVRCTNEQAMGDPSGTVSALMSLAARGSLLEEGPARLEQARLEAVVAAKIRARKKVPRQGKGKPARGRPSKTRTHPTLDPQI